MQPKIRKLSLRKLNLKLVLSALILLTCTFQTSLILTLAKHKPHAAHGHNVAHGHTHVQLINLPENIRFFDDAELAAFVLTNAGIPVSQQAQDPRARIAQVESLSYHRTVNALLTTLDHFLDSSKAIADNQPTKNSPIVPWTGHLERMIFILKHTKIPIDPAAIKNILAFAEKYRGVADTKIFDSGSIFMHDLETLQNDMPKFIEAAINLAPECDTVCDLTAMANVKTILERNRSSHNVVGLLGELKQDLPNIIKSKDILDQLNHIQTIAGPINKKTGELTNIVTLKLRISALISNNRRFMAKHGYVVRS